MIANNYEIDFIHILLEVGSINELFQSSPTIYFMLFIAASAAFATYEVYLFLKS